MEGLTRALKVEYQSHAPAELAGGRSSREFKGGNLDTQNTSHSLDLFFVFLVQAICHHNVQKKMASKAKKTKSNDFRGPAPFQWVSLCR